MAARIEELRARLEAAKQRARAERQRKLELVERLDASIRRACLGIAVRLAGKKVDKKHGEYRVVRIRNIEVWLDTYNGFLAFYVDGRPVTAGYDRETFMQHLEAWRANIEDLEAVVETVEALDEEAVCTLAEMLYEAEGLDAQLAAELRAELLDILEG